MLPVILYYWYLWLDARYVGQAALTIVKKMLLDQFVISPPILITFYTLMSIMEGREDITQELRSIKPAIYLIDRTTAHETRLS